MKKWFETVPVTVIAGVAGFLANVSTVTTWASGIVTNPIARWCSWLICVLLFAIALFPRDGNKTKTLEVDGKPRDPKTTSNRVWVIPLMLTILFALIDVTLYVTGSNKAVYLAGVKK